MREARRNASPPLLMNTSDKNTEQNRKTVGVYDRPASADRRNLWIWVLGFLVAAGAFSAYFFLGA